jgi:hypothetical protein
MYRNGGADAAFRSSLLTWGSGNWEKVVVYVEWQNKRSCTGRRHEQLHLIA